MTGKGRFKAKEWAEFEEVTNDVNNKNEKQVKTTVYSFQLIKDNFQNVMKINNV